jgi:predicted 3-demethylubiquinone-9 3-methyltransferase (glyoxalase superfamily)
MASMQRITPCLWFDTEAEEAAKYYCGIFKNSKLGNISHYGNEGKDVHGKRAGTVLTVEFELNGQKFIALNGGPQFRFNESVSFTIECRDQQEIDYYWEKLGAGGDPSAQVCGWLKDKFGLSWQVAPAKIGEWLAGPSTEKTERVMAEVMKMKKIDLATLERAYEGQGEPATAGRR